MASSATVAGASVTALRFHNIDMSRLLVGRGSADEGGGCHILLRALELRMEAVARCTSEAAKLG